MASVELPFIGIVDLVAQVKGRLTVIDFKTAASDYEDHEVELSDQLTAYWAAVPEAERVALCVLVKTKESRIEWHFAKMKRVTKSLMLLAPGLGRVALCSARLSVSYRIKPNRRRSSSVQPISASIPLRVPIGKVSLSRW